MAKAWCSKMAREVAQLGREAMEVMHFTENYALRH